MPYSKEKKREYDRRRYEENKKYLQEYKVEKGCKDCGWSEHHAGLQFDHLPGHEKKNNVGALGSRNKEGLVEEVKKCEVVCSRCHSIRTWERGQYSTR
jgi:hypothetical protein